jgi:hypothetical protein
MPDNPTRESLEPAFVERVLALVESGQLRPHRNAANHPWIECRVPAMPQLLTSIASEDFRGWLTDLGWTTCGAVPNRGLVDRVCSLLRNRSHGHSRACTDEGVDHELLTNPLMAALVEHMEDEGLEPREHKASEWWTKLHDRASRGNFLQVGLRRFPGGANAMLRQLNRQRAFLASQGFEFDSWRSNGRHLRIWRRSDDVDPKPSAEPSVGNGLLHGDFGDLDARTVAPDNFETVLASNEPAVANEECTDA